MNETAVLNFEKLIVDFLFKCPYENCIDVSFFEDTFFKKIILNNFKRSFYKKFHQDNKIFFRIILSKIISNY